jgi:polyisoprenoid-binding protein YceI
VVSAAAPAFAQTWRIDPAHSRAQFTVRHFMISNIRGDFGAVTGTVEYDGKDVTKARISATIDVNSIDTHVERRDTHLKSDDFLDAVNHPTMTFVSTSITPAGSGKYHMTGELTIRGVTKSVTFELEAPSEPILEPPQGPQRAGLASRAIRVGAAASGKINRKDFGVKWHQVMDNGGLSVSDEVLIQLDVELIQQTPQTN